MKTLLNRVAEILLEGLPPDYDPDAQEDDVALPPTAPTATRPPRETRARRPRRRQRDRAIS